MVRLLALVPPLLLAALPVAAQAAPAEAAPAGGATAGQIAIGAGAATIWTLLLLMLGLGHRSGRSTLLRRLAAPASRLTKLPAWAALPLLVALVGLTLAGVGFVWDVALHMTAGRDEGPFANPSHYMIFVGLLVMLASGWLAVVLPVGDEGPASGLRIADGWTVPAGGIAMLLSGSAAMMAFPLDDFWHRIFGQDVTLWGPTHLVLITGGLLVFASALVLVREGRTVSEGALRAVGRTPARVPLLLGAGAAAVVLTGMTIAYQQEFGYGIPQFRLMYHPVLIALTASLGLVAVRLACGRGAALLAAGLSVALSGLLTVIVGPVLGELTLHFPLYLAEAALVELAALALLRAGRSPYPFAALSGLLIGTLGVLVEYGWSHVWMPLPWPDHLVGPAMLRAVPVAVAGGVIAVFAARCLMRDAAVRRSWAWAPAAVALAVALGLLGSLLPTHAPDGARVTLAVTPAGEGLANVTARFAPRDVAEDADWVQGLSWQQGDSIVTAPLERVSEGVYRTTEPLQVGGSAKAMLRLQRGTTTASVVVRLPADAAIPVGAIPLRRLVTRPLVHDPILIQRERKPDTPRWLWAVACSLVLLLVVSLFATLAWALLRAARLPEAEAAPTPPRREAVGATLAAR